MTTNRKPVKFAGRVAWLFNRIRRKIWFRAALFSLAAISIAALSALAGDYIPFDYSLSLAAGSVDSILNVIATSMLAVTTFSLSIMVAAYGSATSNVTPRSTKVLLADPTAQNTLSTFLGSFIFSIVGIIGLSAGLYDERGRVILFFSTLAVIAIITITLLQWISQLGHFGRVGDTIRRLEESVLPAMQAAGRSPGLGTMKEIAVPSGFVPVYAKMIGTVTHIDVSELQQLAEDEDVSIHLRVLPGSLVHNARPVLMVPVSLQGSAIEKVRDCVTIDKTREFDQDPRFGLVVLAEIASRAMSPAVNDPGTAIDVLGSSLRLFSEFAKSRADAPVEVAHDRVYGPWLAVDDLFSTVFDPIARDSSGTLEVINRMLFVLSALSRTDPTLFSKCADTAAKHMLEVAWADETENWFRRELRTRAEYHSFSHLIPSGQ